jgi:hypothetical protein
MICHLPGPLLAPDQAPTAITAMTMTAVAIVGLTNRAARKHLRLTWDNLRIVALYLVDLAALRATR